MDVLKFLARGDKWFLGGGNRVVWTPTFPKWLETMGFWDPASFYNFGIQPIFTITLLNENGKEIKTSLENRRWEPSHLTQNYKTTNKIRFIERKAVLPNDCLISELEIKNSAPKMRESHVIMWTAQHSSKESYSGRTRRASSATPISDVKYGDGIISFALHSSNEILLPMNRDQNDRTERVQNDRFYCGLGVNHEVSSYSINISEKAANYPYWEYTPFYEKFVNGLGNEIKLNGVNRSGLIYMALHLKLKLKPNSKTKLLFAASIAQTEKEVIKNLKQTLHKGNAINLSVKNWKNYFAQVPYFECSDPFIQKYYWYRWYGLRLFTTWGYKHPCVCEGPGYFRAPISYSAQCHMLETRWFKDPSIAKGSILNFIEYQNKDGSFVGYISPDYPRKETFYHVNWGRSILELYKIHPDDEFLKEIYTPLVKYAEYFDKERDKEGLGLYDIINHFETGQEFMSRYMAVSDKADTKGWGNNFRLKGVDSNVYIYELKKVLSAIGNILGKASEAKRWDEESQKTKGAILKYMWDAKNGIFSDVDPAETMKHTGIKAAVCFYPYMTDIVDGRHIPGLKSHLFNPNEFWTPYPVPSTSVNDPYFSEFGEWKGKRMNCPWNGRVWPMTNSHIAEALAYAANNLDASVKPKAVEFINKFIRMMFHDGDPNRPNSFEHYNPFNGKPSIYRGVDDYQHSWIVDLIIKYVVGIIPQAMDIVIVDPLPFNLDYVKITNVPYKGHSLDVNIEKGYIKVYMDGKLKSEGKGRQEVKWS
jgi:hypothetical protein